MSAPPPQIRYAGLVKASTRHFVEQGIHPNEFRHTLTRLKHRKHDSGLRRHGLHCELHDGTNTWDRERIMGEHRIPLSPVLIKHPPRPIA